MKGPEHFAVINGIGYGEETKGNTVQAVTRQLEAHTVWRSGGWQGGHHIIHDDGREIALSHFGAGVFEGADTYLNHMVISPVELFQEAIQLEDLGIAKPLDHLFIDENCLVTTPFHSGISRTREILRGENKKGTIGKGVGEAVRDSGNPELSIRAGEFKDRYTILRKIENIRQAKLKMAEELLAAHPGFAPEEVYSELDVLKDESLVPLVADSFKYAADIMHIVGEDHLKSLLKRNGSMVNEVSHGTLHHPEYGFIPHVTQIDPTSRDVLATVHSRNYEGNIVRLGVVRSYLTRHGAGPLVSFDKNLTKTLTETHNNAANEWLGEFRVGQFDTVALKYALKIGGGKDSYDGLFLSYMDILANRSKWEVVDAYEYQGSAPDVKDYFEFDQNKIVGIKMDKNPDEHAHYRHQGRLTQFLNECSPIVRTLKATENQTLEEVFLEYVNQKLEVPVIGTAYGPKVTDRHFLLAWQKALHKEH
jgi:adenylosuccinate synthase